MTALLEACGLDIGYGRGGVVRQLDLEVRSGEIVALLGPNGAGKTTTVMALCGELTPTAGTVRWNGEATTLPLHRRARQGLGIVTEERSVFMGLTVEENLRVGKAGRIAVELFPEL